MFNITVTTALFMFSVYPLLCWRGVSCGYDLPNLSTTLIGVAIHVCTTEVYFYYGHRCVARYYSERTSLSFISIYGYTYMKFFLLFMHIYCYIIIKWCSEGVYMFFLE